MPNTKQQPARSAVDLTRKTPWGTLYRIVRAATVNLSTSDGKPWGTICLEHDVH
jgi:hypothetical protein